MRLLHLLWPHLPLRLARARMETPSADGTSGSWPPGPIVLGGQPWTDGTVVDADPLARALGVRRGIPLGSAHRLAPEATFLDPAPDADRDAVEAACERLAAFSPGIAGTSDVTDPAFGRIAVHVDGLTRLWGVEESARRPDGDRARARSCPGRPARGSPGRRSPPPSRPRTRRRAGRRSWSRRVTTSGSSPPTRRGLLTRDADVRARLARFGLRTIGSVAELPRSALVARFGEEGALVHARARGEETERFRPRRAPERMALGLELDPPAEGLEAIRFVLRRLAAALADQLAARGRAAGLARLTVTHDLAFARRGTPPELRIEQRLPEPTADAEAIERLLLARLESRPAAGRRRPPGAGARRSWSRHGASSCRCSRPRPPGTPAWAGSWRGWRSRSGRTGCGGWSWPTPRRRSRRRAGAGGPVAGAAVMGEERR